MRRVLVTGSRSWRRKYPILREIDRLNRDETLIVHGACRTGADAIADFYARALRFKIERYPADWKKHGRAAGPIRNREMVNSLRPGRDIVLAFWDGESPGTLGTIELARDRGIAVTVFKPDGTRY